MNKYRSGFKLFSFAADKNSFLRCGEKVKAVFCLKVAVYNACLYVCGKRYNDSFNEDEPYDRKTHVFYVDKNALSEGIKLTLSFNLFSDFGPRFHIDFLFNNEFENYDNLINKYDSGLKPRWEETTVLSDGVKYSHILYSDKNSKPVHIFICDSDMKSSGIYVGTPNDGYESKKVRATIPDMIDAAVASGKDVIAAVNGDFFDIFGDFHPAGLCVKNGIIIANENSSRPFFGIKKDGTPVITHIGENKDIVKELDCAVSGIYMILKDGEINDIAPMEPFSYVRHPRTCIGIRKDSSVIILVADGRIPDYSNGTTLVDLAKLMQSMGADRALNLDGGGSSAIYTKSEGKYILRSRPADLFKPMAGLIRKDFNSVMIISK